MIRETTPPEITEPILRLCNLIVPEAQPFYVEVNPMPGAEPSDCFPNVERCVEKFGGKRILGRAIWQYANILVEAEAHAIWEQADGQLVDITPHVYGERKILFLRDQSMVYDGMRKPNIRLALTDSPLVKEQIELCNEKDHILSESVGPVRLPVALASRIDCITKQFHTVVGRNEPCPCGSGIKYKKCCGKYSY